MITEIELTIINWYQTENSGCKKRSTSTTLEDLFNKEDDEDFEPNGEEDIDEHQGDIGSGDEEVISEAVEVPTKRPAKVAARKKAVKDQPLL